MCCRWRRDLVYGKESIERVDPVREWNICWFLMQRLRRWLKVVLVGLILRVVATTATTTLVRIFVKVATQMCFEFNQSCFRAIRFVHLLGVEILLSRGLFRVFAIGRRQVPMLRGFGLQCLGHSGRLFRVEHTCLNYRLATSIQTQSESHARVLIKTNQLSFFYLKPLLSRSQLIKATTGAHAQVNPFGPACAMALTQ